MEIWVDIADFENYQVSSWGRVRSQNGILNPYETEKGYLRVSLCKKGRRYKMRVHRLVAEAFIPNPNLKPQVNHKDGNKKNNSITNLEWVTDGENKDHRRMMKSMSDILRGGTK